MSTPDQSSYTLGASVHDSSCAQDLRCLLLSPVNNWSTRTVVAFPGEIEFDDLTERWTVYDPPTYSAVISPETEEDLLKIVKLATHNNVSFLATGGRHGYGTTLGKLKNGLAIDLSQLRDIIIDQTMGTLTVGPGVRMRDLMVLVHNAGYQIQTGSCTTPSLIGVTLGGGITRWAGIYGLINDALLSARIITASGQFLDVNDKSYPDLFWGLRGAGFNFGIVTKATYQLHKLPDATDGGGNLVNLDMIFPANQTSAYFKLLESYSGSLPARLAVATAIHYDVNASAPSVLANWVYLGPEAEGRKAMAPVLDLLPPVANMSVIPWHELLSVQGFGLDAANCNNGVIRDIYSVNVRKLSADTFEDAFSKMADFYAEYPGGRNSVIELEIFPNQASVSVQDNESAYPWRDAVGNFLFVFSWKQGDSAVADASNHVGQDLRQTFAKSSGYPHLAVYVSYAHGDEPIESIYGAEKLPRLVGLKQHWDPTNVFAYNNAIPTQCEGA